MTLDAHMNCTEAAFVLHSLYVICLHPDTRADLLSWLVLLKVAVHLQYHLLFWGWWGEKVKLEDRLFICCYIC